MSHAKKRSKKPLAILIVTAVLVAGGGAAFAYWSATGTGSGSASTGTNVPVTVVQTSTVSNLRPGAPAQTLSGTFNNTNDGPAYVANVVATVGTIVKATGATTGTCDATDYTITGGTMVVAAQVPSGNQGTWTGATVTFNNKGTVNQDACKNAAVTINYVAN